MPPQLPQITQHWRHVFHALMPFRIREVLLVSSAYDAFMLEEDGPLSDQLFMGYSELNLTWAPRITHASTARDALQLLDRRPFQLVIMVAEVEDATADQLSMAVKEKHPHLPVMLLLFDQAAGHPNGQIHPCIDRTFLWTGDAGIIIAGIKLIEDQLNVSHDVQEAGVQVILVVEDSIRVYSTFIAQLYPELLLQSQSLIAEGLNGWHRVMRMRARPKILLAQTYEEAIALHRFWRDNVMAVISDVQFPRGGELVDDAGIQLARAVGSGTNDSPILLMSTNPGFRAAAEAAGAWFVQKNSPDFLKELRSFLKIELGFGDFVFTLPDGSECGRARDIYEMEEVLQHVPALSIQAHGERNDFSVWLKARSMFQIASHMRQTSAAEFEESEQMRAFLLDVLAKARDHEQMGIVTDISGSRAEGSDNRFVRLGTGSLGGKGRSIGFVSSLLFRRDLIKHLPDLEIRIPKTVAIGVDEFDRFVAQFPPNELDAENDVALRERLILDGRLSRSLTRDLRRAWKRLKGPLAVRSSSLLEDSRFQPFAGVYATFMLPNNHPDPEVRFAELCRAIRAVYASMFAGDARRYTAGLPHGVDDEKMAVVIQQLVGQAHGDRFYPHISGVAQSYNYYPIGSQRAEEGVAIMALGLGQAVVGDGAGLRFSPASPSVLPQFPTPRHLLNLSQRSFYALDLSNPLVDLTGDPGGLLQKYDLAAAEQDGTLALAGSVYSVADDAIRPNLKLAGPRVVSFENVLRWRAIPLPEAVTMLLEELEQAVGTDVEMEFAVDMADWGREPQGGRSEPRVPRLYVLQVRPMARLEHTGVDIDFDALPPESIICETKRSLGHGYIDDVRDVVYVKPDRLEAVDARAAAREVRAMNETFHADQRRYVLIGPGRWGTADASLGVPVDWMHICNARVIVETYAPGNFVEPSQGSHFFHNVTAARLGYLTVVAEEGVCYDRAWLDAQPAAQETPLVRHVRLGSPLRVHLDGRHGRGAILKPQ